MNIALIKTILLIIFFSVVIGMSQLVIRNKLNQRTSLDEAIDLELKRRKLVNKLLEERIKKMKKSK